MKESKTYTKRPVSVQAIQWTGDNYKEVEEFARPNISQYHPPEGNEGLLWVETLEGGHKASPGDYIIKGVKGEFYPCKPDIFELTYTEN